MAAILKKFMYGLYGLLGPKIFTMNLIVRNIKSTTGPRLVICPTNMVNQRDILTEMQYNINLAGIVDELARLCGVPALNIHRCYEHMPLTDCHTPVKVMVADDISLPSSVSNL